MQLSAISKIIRPSIGDETSASEANLGGKKPLIVDSISKTAEGWGVVVPIPTWPYNTCIMKIRSVRAFRFMILSFL